MAEIITKSYRCDRCAIPLGDHPGRQPITVTAFEESEWAAAWKVEWRDLCNSCQRDVVDFFRQRPRPKVSNV